MTVAESGPRLIIPIFLAALKVISLTGWRLGASGVRAFQFDGGVIVMCGKYNGCCSFGSCPRGNGGGVHVAVEVVVVSLVCQTMPVVIVNETV